MEQPDQYVQILKDGNPVYDGDGDVLIRRICDGKHFYVSPDRIESHQLTEPELDVNNNTEEENLTENKHWTNEEILKLIHLYNAYRSHFASTTTKNIKVWQKIARELGTHNPKQCENKFKYLKSKYLQKKDNMSQRSSGAKNIQFQYFEELDEIFGKQPIVQPLAIASSSRSDSNSEPAADQVPQSAPADDQAPEAATESTQSPNQGATETTQNNSGPRSRRSIKLKEAIIDLNNILEEAEADKCRRHSELMELQRETAKQFAELMGKILEKM